MKIAVMTDSHDHVWNLGKAIDQINAMGISLVIHCGDFIAPFSVKEFSKIKGVVHCTFGNNDGDKYEVTKVILTSLRNVQLYGEFGEIEVDGKKIAFTHSPWAAEGLAATGRFHVVFHGHTHAYEKRKIGNTLIVNAGEIMGRKGKGNFVLYDTTSDEITLIQLE